MATKYVVNTKKMAFKFQNGLVLERKGVLAVNEEQLDELESDYFFKGLKEKGAITVSLVKPSEYATPGEIIAADNAKISALEKEVAMLKAQLAEAEAIGSRTPTVIDSSDEGTSDEVTEIDSESANSEGTKKRTSKKNASK